MESLKERLLRKADEYRTRSRSYNHAGNKELDAYYDGKYEGLREASEALGVSPPASETIGRLHVLLAEALRCMEYADSYVAARRKLFYADSLLDELASSGVSPSGGSGVPSTWTCACRRPTPPASPSLPREGEK